MNKVAVVKDGKLKLTLEISNKVLNGTPRMLSEAGTMRIALKDKKPVDGVVFDTRSKVDGNFLIEELGSYFGSEGFSAANGDKIDNVSIKQGTGSIEIKAEAVWGTTTEVTVS